MVISWRENTKQILFKTSHPFCGCNYFRMPYSQCCLHLIMQAREVYMRTLLPEAGISGRDKYGLIITSRSLLWDVIIYPCLRYLQKQVSQPGIRNYIPQFTVGCNYSSLFEIPASGNRVLISTPYHPVGSKTSHRLHAVDNVVYTP